MKAMQMNLSVLVKQPNRSFASALLAFSLFRFFIRITRTLQRRIAEEGSSFRELLSDARRELARLSLQHPSLGLSKMASLLGYEDPNSFLRAFRMWEGVTPSEWRAMEKAGRSKRPRTDIAENRKTPFVPPTPLCSNRFWSFGDGYDFK
jgi:AraC-like DNA-binding protein